MKFSRPSDHVTKLCFLEAVVSAGRELLSMFPCSISTSALQTFPSSSSLLCTLMEINLLAVVQGCQTGNTLQSLVLSEKQNG